MPEQVSLYLRKCVAVILAVTAVGIPVLLLVNKINPPEGDAVPKGNVIVLMIGLFFLLNWLWPRSVRD